MSPSLGFQYQPCEIPTLSWWELSDILALSCESQLALPHRINAVVISPLLHILRFNEKSIYSVASVCIILSKGTENTAVALYEEDI